jgi:hypothetical protein
MLKTYTPTTFLAADIEKMTEAYTIVIGMTSLKNSHLNIYVF